jgi:hypothetical protein
MRIESHFPALTAELAATAALAMSNSQVCAIKADDSRNWNQNHIINSDFRNS